MVLLIQEILPPMLLGMAFAEAIGFDFECDLPYKAIKDFCMKYVPTVNRDSIFELATRFCNDSFKIPLCLYYHPKLIAAACIHMAALWRKKKGQW